MRPLIPSAAWPVITVGAILTAGCGNDPYPSADADKKIYYGYLERSYDMDPVSAQSIAGLSHLGAICEPLLEYHYLERPLVLQPLLARSVPAFEPITEPGLQPGDPPRPLCRLRFEVWDGVLFHRSVCFDRPDHRQPATREMTADDFEFTFMRIADPKNNCPAYDSFERIDGLREWTDTITRIRSADPAADRLPIRALYERVGKIRGVRVTGRYGFDLVLTQKFPILLYWLGFCFGAPTPYEAVEYYDGLDGRRHLRDWPIGTGPYRMVAHDQHEFIAFEKNPDWRGITQPHRRLPGTVYPSEGALDDREAGLLDPRYVGRPLPFIDRFEYRRDKEAVSRFGKFAQGYYDAQEIVEQTFNQALAAGALTTALRDRGIRLSKQTMPRIWYFAFNMDDDDVGAPVRFTDAQREKDHDLWIERNRKLRRAMSLAYDVEHEIEVFLNGRATKAESPLPPGVFGYDPEYRHPFGRYDPQLTQARQLMAEAGYPGGMDPRTGRPLRITMSIGDTDPRTLEETRMYARQFGRLGIDLEIDAVTYNAFVQKMARGSFQLLSWGWYADYPDPQTFLLLFYGPESTTGTGRNNKANFRHARYDLLYSKMIGMSDDESATWTETDSAGVARTVTMTRYEIIREMIRIIAYECPWIIRLHPQAYVLYHEWYHNIKPSAIVYNDHKYRDIDASLRRERRQALNRPVRWPAGVLAVGSAALIAPAVRTYLRRTRR